MQFRSFPKVSVLVPAFNEEKYIPQALNALIAQDYPNYEIIVANNASTDRTALYVQEFIKRNTTSIPVRLLHENRKGTNFARECARNAASGSVIAQLDADCIPSSDWLRKGVLSLCKNGRVAVTGPYDYFDSTRVTRFGTLLMQKLTYPFISMAVQLMGRGAILIGGNAFVRADVLEMCGGYNTDLTFYGDDVELGEKLCHLGHVAYDASLVQRSSARRYKANGFWEVNTKYQAFFWNLILNKRDQLQTAETSHPR